MEGPESCKVARQDKTFGIRRWQHKPPVPLARVYSYRTSPQFQTQRTLAQRLPPIAGLFPPGVQATTEQIKALSTLYS